MYLDFINFQIAGVGDYIFLIIIILASIIQAISQNRKKAESARAEQEKTRREVWEDDEDDEDKSFQQPVEKSPRGSFFEEIEKVFIPELPEEEQYMGEEDIPVNQTSTKLKETPALHSNITEEELNNVLQEDHSAIDNNRYLKGENKGIRKRILTEGFSLKKAVIYSEILNRKYS